MKILGILSGIGVLIGIGLIVSNPSGTTQGIGSVESLIVDETKALQLR